MKANNLLEIVRSFYVTKRSTRAGVSRDQFEDWQSKALQIWLENDLPRVKFFENEKPDLKQLPIMDKSLLMTRFADFNLASVSADQAWSALERDVVIHDFMVGASTGTSGNRGLFLISNTEKYRWLGSILAKTMSDMLFKAQKIAIILPRNSGLYESAKTVRHINLHFFDVNLGIENWRVQLENFAPTIIVAQPKILRAFAEQELRLSPKRIFSAAETLDPIDRKPIEEFYKLPLEQIYMATEGLLAVTCRDGGLHLAEDSVHFEFEELGNGLVSPLISSFRRQTQILARYRMNDLLRLSNKLCRCGSPLQLVEEVVGRMDDVMVLAGKSGDVIFTPDILRNAVIDSDRRINDFHLLLVKPNRFELHLNFDLPEDVALAAKASLSVLMAKRGVVAEIKIRRSDLKLDTRSKLRRVENRLGSAGQICMN